MLDESVDDFLATLYHLCAHVSRIVQPHLSIGITLVHHDRLCVVDASSTVSRIAFIRLTVPICAYCHATTSRHISPSCAFA